MARIVELQLNILLLNKLFPHVRGQSGFIPGTGVVLPSRETLLRVTTMAGVLTDRMSYDTHVVQHKKAFSRMGPFIIDYC